MSVSVMNHDSVNEADKPEFASSKVARVRCSN